MINTKCNKFDFSFFFFLILFYCLVFLLPPCGFYFHRSLRSSSSYCNQVARCLLFISVSLSQLFFFNILLLDLVLFLMNKAIFSRRGHEENTTKKKEKTSQNLSIFLYLFFCFLFISLIVAFLFLLRCPFDLSQCCSM